MHQPSWDLTAALSRHFGFSAFRPGQEEAIKRLLRGENLLVVMPTGSGKSLCYQLPALLRDGTTLVVSPLIALMKDQSDALRVHGIPATVINSSISWSEQMARLEEMRTGRFRLVYVSPERFRNASFIRSVASTHVSLFVIDEAHCISEWGHDFRPDYLYLKEAIRSLNGGRESSMQIVALTATATRRVQQDIVRQLDIPGMGVLVTGFNRENLFFQVRYASRPNDKYRLLAEILRQYSDGKSSGIIYCGTRRDAESVAEFVRDHIGLYAETYHAGLPDHVRRKAHENFRSGNVPVFAATNAFGMGVDKSDIRFVVHFTIPQSAEAYYQEAGRAGRDGLPARCTLLYCPDDRSLIEFLIRSEVPNTEDMGSLFSFLLLQMDPRGIVRIRGMEIERALQMRETKQRSALHQLAMCGMIRRGEDGPSGMTIEILQRNLDPPRITEIERCLGQRLAFKKGQVEQIIRFAETNDCRRQYILAYFGDRMADPNPARDCCDNCNQSSSIVDTESLKSELPEPLATIAPTVLTCIARLSFPLGRDKIADLLRGSRAKWVSEWKLDRNPFHGALSEYTSLDLREWIDHLLTAGWLKRVGGKQPVITITPAAAAIIRRAALHPPPKEVLPAPSGTEKPATGRSTAHVRDTSGESTIFITLRLFRSGKKIEEIAKERGLAESTISSHLAELIRIGAVDIDQLMDKATRDRIEDAVARVGGNQLRPIMDLLTAEDDGRTSRPTSWGQINYVLAARAFEAGLTPPELTVRSDDLDTSQPPIDDSTELSAEAADLFKALKAWRIRKAHERGVSPFIIFHDAVLGRIALNRPRTPASLRHIRGVGDSKVREYGHEILNVVRRHADVPHQGKN